ncbi:hypothetical protein FS837_006819 [Tulasnella sp. UAMH 9824]|nr:hypothetical protein FS837_006819 [Tulasnella sp. UAMH 9824]
MPFNWRIFPSPNPQFPQYHPSDFYTAYLRPTNVPTSTSDASGPSSSPVTTPLAAGAAPAAGVQRPTQPERPLTRKERKAKAKLEAKENKMAEVEAKFRFWQEEEEEKAQEAEEAERLRMAEEEWSERKESKKLRKLNEEIRKSEEELRRLDEEIKRGEEELRRLDEEEREEEKRKEREEAQAKAEEEHRQQRLRRIAEEANSRFRAGNQEKISPTDPSGGSWFPSAHQPFLAPKPPGKWDSIWRINDLNRVEYPEGIQRPLAELDNGRIMPGGRYKHVYDRDFLLQFWDICEEKPEWASDLTGLGVEYEDPVHRLKNAFPRITGRTNSGRTATLNSTFFATLVHAPSDDLGSASMQGRLKGQDTQQLRLDDLVEEQKFLEETKAKGSLNAVSANAREPKPVGVAGPRPMTPSPSFFLPKRSTTIKLSNPKTGETVFLQSPDPVDAAEAVGVGRSDQPERPLTKRQRKMKAKWEAEEKQREEEAERAQKEAEEPERLRTVQEEETNPEEDEVRTLEEELRQLEEEMRKGEEELKRREAERREAEEDLMKLKEEHWIQRDDNERFDKVHEEAEEKIKVEEAPIQRLAADENAGFRTNNKEQNEELKKLEDEVRKEEKELKRREEERRKAEEEVVKLEEQYRIQLDRRERAHKEQEEAEATIKAEEAQKHGLSNLEGLGVERGEKVDQVSDPSRRLAGREETRRLGLAFAPSAFTSNEVNTPQHNHDSSVTRGRPQGQDTQQLHSDVLAEKQENSRDRVAEFANHHTLNTIFELGRQMEILFKEMKDLKNEVRELSNETNSGNKRGRNKVQRPPAAT